MHVLKDVMSLLAVVLIVHDLVILMDGRNVLCATDQEQNSNS